MRLAQFILGNLDSILQEWDAFARAAETSQTALNPKSLRNHAEQILKTVAKDLLTPQTARQQDNSRGLGFVSTDATAAQTYAVLRLTDGFSLDQMVAEYRALRASVLRLWLAHEQGPVSLQLEDMVRFNEAIDQALGESITAYGNAVETTRKTVLAVLGHDLRSPLTAVLMGSQLLEKHMPSPSRQHDIATQITRSARRANQMIQDLLDLARCNLSIGLPVALEYTELCGICSSIIDEVRMANPKVDIIFDNAEKVTGQFDPTRIAQVFSNLIANAVLHGDARRPIRVDLKQEVSAVRFQVQNHGDPIPPGALHHLFNPQGRYSSYSDDSKDRSQGLGLGLFIAAQIVEGHGGRIDVSSDAEQGTRFAVILPTP
ncbi:ATP-binding protein [Pseudomonas plecoglossicida]|uniref:ATP-binding protein n=1 Tax=Pseudomonas plecoglossicida TaxID=70775 RepID=UPI003D25E5DC